MLCGEAGHRVTVAIRASRGAVCAFGGTGGSLMVIDADRRMTFAYVMNKMGSGAIAAALAERVKDIVTREATRSTCYPSSSR